MSRLTDILAKQLTHLTHFHALRQDYDRQLKRSISEDGTILDDTDPQRVKDLLNRIRQLTPRTDAAASKTIQHDAPEHHLPRTLLDAYSELVDRAYNLPAPYIGDVNTIHGSGKALRARTSTGQTATRGGAHQKKNIAQSQKTVLKDERIVNIKLKADKKLRAIARDIEQEISNGFTPKASVTCLGCGRIQNPENKYCPRCGRKIT